MSTTPFHSARTGNLVYTSGQTVGGSRTYRHPGLVASLPMSYPVEIDLIIEVI